MKQNVSAPLTSSAGWGTREAFRSVLDYVDDSSPHVRKFVIRALGRINTPEARDKLKEIEAKDPVDYIRALASERLLMADKDK